MKLSQFDYHLPAELIAQEPLPDRSASRMLWLHRATGAVEHLMFRDLPSILTRGDLVVLNDTRVTARRLIGRRPTGGQVEALLLRSTPDGHEALTRPSKKLRPGERLEFADGLRATVKADLGQGRKLIEFEGATDLSRVGSIPLPPYVQRELADEDRYQTAFANSPGSAAAPTAGLHFTADLIGELRARGTSVETVTLDVGLDTFRPVGVEEVEQHEMHGERCAVSAATVQSVASCVGRVVAVGTTTVRTLETFSTNPRQLSAGETVSRLFIKPGYRFLTVDGMLTNFHLPKTTMLVMVAALAGVEATLSAYKAAVRENYRFLSFGDAMLVL